MHRLGGNARDDDAGFTLVELVVVVLIIAIPLAIAIPSFLGARQKPVTGRRSRTSATP